MAQAGLAAQKINGYEREEPSHSAVAQAIRAGAADAGLGIEHTARAFGLGFVPLAEEHYSLVCHKAMLEQPPVRALRAMLARQDWQQRLAGMPGYSPNQCGDVLALRQALPWWSYAQRRRPAP